MKFYLFVDFEIHVTSASKEFSLLNHISKSVILLINVHYMNISVFIKFSQKTSVFTLIIISSP